MLTSSATQIAENSPFSVASFAPPYYAVGIRLLLAGLIPAEFGLLRGSGGLARIRCKSVNTFGAVPFLPAEVDLSASRTEQERSVRAQFLRVTTNISSCGEEI